MNLLEAVMTDTTNKQLVRENRELRSLLTETA